MVDILESKRILIVDDEPDILETLEELLDMCLIDSAPDFHTACKFLDKYSYDAAILDIMGVRGYELLQITEERDIPAVMLTAHALNPENLVKSIKMGAQCYVPKDKIGDIALYLADVFNARQQGIRKHGNWFKRLKPFFDKKFGSGWRESHKKFWEDFDKDYRVTKDELENIM
jgi:DNA-binding NtrC family response regulator